VRVPFERTVGALYQALIGLVLVFWALVGWWLTS
jgi:hypothetical protein